MQCIILFEALIKKKKTPGHLALVMRGKYSYSYSYHLLYLLIRENHGLS